MPKTFLQPCFNPMDGVTMFYSLVAMGPETASKIYLDAVPAEDVWTAIMEARAPLGKNFQDFIWRFLTEELKKKIRGEEYQVPQYWDQHNWGSPDRPARYTLERISAAKQRTSFRDKMPGALLSVYFEGDKAAVVAALEELLSPYYGEPTFVWIGSGALTERLVRDALEPYLDGTFKLERPNLASFLQDFVVTLNEWAAEGNRYAQAIVGKFPCPFCGKDTYQESVKYPDVCTDCYYKVQWCTTCQMDCTDGCQCD